MNLDARWLELLKASGWKTLALALGLGAWLYLVGLGIVREPEPAWIMAVVWLAFSICAALATVSVAQTLSDFFQPWKWLDRWMNEHRSRKRIRDYIPFVTTDERAIIAYLLHHNLKTITTAQGGGLARTLISREILVCALLPKQPYDNGNIPYAVPDHVWTELAAHKHLFPYDDSRPPATYPWREHFLAR